MSEQRLAGKIAVITGGARGMGAATARRFVEAGAQVIVADLLEAEGAALVEELGAAATFQRLDVSDEGSWADLVSAATRNHGRIDALVNNAAVVAFGPIVEFTSEQIDRVLGINVKGTMLGLKHIGGLMCEAKGGAIVNISSVDGLRGVNSLGLYSSSKWAVRGLTKTAALEFGHHGVRVNSVHPGGVNTVMGNPQGLEGEAKNEGYERVALQRIGEPEEIAAATLFLCSDEASYVTGAELAVDGGWGAGYYHHFLPGAPAALTSI
ncbi:SDR family NAD(P)-dependent oxidoreductase [Novosphingobium sp. P6W]|uniref:SDR family NAD(P)-dependent oxidoreductase n=1 Tax=Novosphingobium sp. P6W TaxID=1609758 RepID=UPI0005C2E717|nr:glucose 1-dehydrogenase [Novosphingobium sp. P6W]AXB80316.1 SDR family NAD(P)-dependent oxidoreductase [Novosphingobium sp. P6W]KIS31649.1 3-alpha-hydroxysteroid dehydrogenase [Novosphingobium sp. P6W]